MEVFWLVIILLLVLLFLFSGCTLKCNGGEKYEQPSIYSSLSSMGWPSGPSVFYNPDDLGPIGLYYVLKPVTAPGAYALANNFQGVIANKHCIKKIGNENQLLVSGTPDDLFYNPQIEGGYLITGRLQNGKLHSDEVLSGEDNKTARGMFAYGPIPKSVGIAVYIDSDEKYSQECLDWSKHVY